LNISRGDIVKRERIRAEAGRGLRTKGLVKNLPIPETDGRFCDAPDQADKGESLYLTFLFRVRP
jgi:hypothetical protein